MGHFSSEFFVLRTPLLPVEDFLSLAHQLKAPRAVGDSENLQEALAADRSALRAHLRALLDREDVTEALFLASPDLVDAVSIWREAPDCERGQRVERALVRYLTRAATRPTPFGLFAGCSVGTIAPDTRMTLASLSSYRRHSRLDMQFLTSITEALLEDQSVRHQLLYRTNSSLYRAAGKVRYVASRMDGEARQHRLVAIAETPHLSLVLERAQDGVTVENLVKALSEAGAGEIAASRFVDRLISRQVLVGDLEPVLTGTEPGAPLTEALRNLTKTELVADRLEHAILTVASFDAQGLGRSPAEYRKLASELNAMPAKPVLSRLVQVDLHKPVHVATLGTDIAAELQKSAELLRRVARPRAKTDLHRFVEAVNARFEHREVDMLLTDLLDPEIGVGFGPAVEPSPLLKTVRLHAEDDRKLEWTARDEVLLRKLLEAADTCAREIELSSEDIDALTFQGHPNLPNAFSVIASIAAGSWQDLETGNYRLILDGVDGPSGASLFGRFCHGNPELTTAVRRHLAAEQALDPDAIYADVVHQPEGRIGNVVLRPLLREWEIPYLGRSGAAASGQIFVNDLRVAITADRVELYSVRMGRRVVPRLTTAHDYRALHNTGIYRFLCALQDQETHGFGWDWGALGHAPFLPRVRSGRVVLSRACWQISAAELRTLACRGEALFAAVQRWRTARRLPRLIVLVDDDNTLPVDLDNILSLEAFAQLVSRRPRALLEEVLPSYDELPVEGPEGRFVAELIVPFVGVRRDTSPAREPVPSPPSGSLRSRLLPGSEWLYVKLYAGKVAVDEMLRDVMGPFAIDATVSGAADRWFFIRYGDPDWHLRLRMHGDAARLHDEVLPGLYERASALSEEGRLLRMQLDTYERETERYGGSEAMGLTEQIFHADSTAVYELLRRIDHGNAGLEERWRLGLVGVDLLLDACGLDLLAKRDLVRRMRSSIGEGLGVDASAKTALSKRFREHRVELEALLHPTTARTSELAPGVEILAARSKLVATLVARHRSGHPGGWLDSHLAEFAASHAHMHLNRLLRSRHHQQELVIYDFLARLYASRVARAEDGG